MRQKQGFTLVEVLLAIVILAFASVFIFRAFFTSLSAIEESRDRLVVLKLAHETLNLAKIKAQNGEFIYPYRSKGKKNLQGKEYSYVLSIDSANEAKNLAKIDLIYYWFVGNRRINLSHHLIWPLDLKKG